MKTLAQPVSQLAFICKIMKKKWFLQIFAEKISVRTQTASSVYAHYGDLWKIKLLMTLMVYIHDINDKNCFVEFTLNTFFIIVWVLLILNCTELPALSKIKVGSKIPTN